MTSKSVNSRSFSAFERSPLSLSLSLVGDDVEIC